MCGDWLKIVFPKLDRNTELTWAVVVMMAWTKGIYILKFKVNKLFFSESLGELEKAVEILPYGLWTHSISCSPKLFINGILLRVPTDYLSFCPQCACNHKTINCQGYNNYFSKSKQLGLTLSVSLCKLNF